MKRFFSISLLTFLAIATMSAQKVQDPKGLYHLQKFIFEDGSEKTPGYIQLNMLLTLSGCLFPTEKPAALSNGAR